MILNHLVSRHKLQLQEKLNSTILSNKKATESTEERPNEIEVNYTPLDYLPLNLEIFFKKPIYHVRVICIPEQPRRFLK